jgi:hypothetical protein
LKEFHDQIYEEIIPITEKLRKNGFSIEELVDLGYFFRETERLLDEWRKNAKARRELCERLLGVNVQDDPTIHGEHATATLDATLEHELPKVGTDEYRELCEHFGIPSDGLFRPHWKAMNELVQDAIMNGKKKPPGLGRQWTKFHCVFRSRG